MAYGGNPGQAHNEHTYINEGFEEYLQESSTTDSVSNILMFKSITVIGYILMVTNMELTVTTMDIHQG